MKEKKRMAVSPEDLEEVLTSVGEDLIAAKEAQAKSIGNELSLAKSILKLLVTKINDKISKTERIVIEKVNTSNESPAISLVTAALEKKGYQVAASGDRNYTQFIVNW
jgi:hypothetical protein